MRLREKLEAPFPYYLNDERKNVVFILFVSAFVVFFLQVYHVSHHHHIITIGHKFIFGGITFLVLIVDIVVLPRFFPKAFDPAHWTVGKYILLTLLHCVGIGAVIPVVEKLFLFPEMPFWELVEGSNRQIAQTGVITITIMTLFLRNNVLKQNLRSATKANQELDKIKTLKKENLAGNGQNLHLTLHSETTETLSFHLPDLLYIEADDNYSTVVWRDGKGIHKKLLRANLKNIEGQIDNNFAIRCHRSYLVNVNAIGNISGNANGYKLQILDTDISIPVSRAKGKELIDKIQQLRNAMEVA
ncbi:LytR/AlgR family response regulator transcription factor [Chryseolinea lacunae]|uniref:LytTR family transcriptional regulator DNA-binding domain-containing protein n=1 Tax=Chryseolinea lacunae TaxID=2801331 RepID=A0ABS1KM40_9BACT|nr:LytTR family DNA-binding domain-containing protein [Chryseolinea lacunae]MBL0740293.1 LytTR family transcriptional regulator DNA-binding domain-containing protein [Chryseolinea lacunae]